MGSKISLPQEIEDFLSIKKTNSTRRLYRTGFRHFLEYYKEKHGEEATFQNFINVIYDEIEKP